jgi:hypothetical protein
LDAYDYDFLKKDEAEKRALSITLEKEKEKNPELYANIVPKEIKLQINEPQLAKKSPIKTQIEVPDISHLTSHTQLLEDDQISAEFSPQQVDIPTIVPISTPSSKIEVPDISHLTSHTQLLEDDQISAEFSPQQVDIPTIVPISTPSSKIEVPDISHLTSHTQLLEDDQISAEFSPQQIPLDIIQNIHQILNISSPDYLEITDTDISPSQDNVEWKDISVQKTQKNQEELNIASRFDSHILNYKVPLKEIPDFPERQQETKNQILDFPYLNAHLDVNTNISWKQLNYINKVTENQELF